jgi:hypothetical protein
MKSFVTHDFVLSKAGALRRNVCGVCSDNCQNETAFSKRTETWEEASMEGPL